MGCNGPRYTSNDLWCRCTRLGSALPILVAVEELASKEKTQAPPAWVVWDALADPGHPGSSAWLDLADGEVAPQVLEASRPALVVWSSLWPDRPRDRVRFELRPKDAAARCDGVC
jgi:hypothetical protein